MLYDLCQITLLEYFINLDNAIIFENLRPPELKQKKTIWHLLFFFTFAIFFMASLSPSQAGLIATPK